MYRGIAHARLRIGPRTTRVKQAGTKGKILQYALVGYFSL